MKLLFYSFKVKKIIELKWNEYNILNNLLNNTIRLPKLNETNLITNEYINLLKKKISTLDKYIPLYNIKIRYILVVNIDNILNLIESNIYRFPDKNLITNIKNQINKYKNKKILKIQKIYYNKLVKIYKFIKNFNYDYLYKSYYNIVSNKPNLIKNITTLEKISYLPFINNSKSYYTKKEIINMSLNFNYINIFEKKKTYDNDYLLKLYNKIIKQDFNSSLLLNNLYYIYKTNNEDIIKFYTFHGSYYINYYLRDTKNKIKDNFLEYLIKKLWNIILNAPKLKTEKIVYRFISEDFFLSNLKINDIYQDKGFLSTTRNQFYDVNSEKFGYILLKIKLPINSKGCLCVETYSYFNDEEEVILPPNSKLKLINKDNNVNFYHINDYSQKKIVKKYEFVYLGNKLDYKILKKKSENIHTFNLFDFKLIGKQLGEKIDYFYNEIIKYNKFKKFYLQVNNKKILFYCDFYDSSDIYSKFFYLKKTNGFYIYNIDNNGNYNYFIEFGKQLYVNYINKFSNIKKDINYDTDDNDFLDLLSSISYAFNINTIILFNKYISNMKHIKKKDNFEDLSINSAYITNYNYDIYNYLKFRKKRFNSVYITENFNYFYLDYLEKIKIDNILDKFNNDKLYDIFKNNYNKENNLKYFYIYINENFWYLLSELNKLLYYIFKDLNQSFEFTYTFNVNYYLFNKNIIKILPKFIKKDNLTDNLYYKEIFNKNYKKKLRSIEF